MEGRTDRFYRVHVNDSSRNGDLVSSSVLNFRTRDVGETISPFGTPNDVKLSSDAPGVALK